MPSLESHTTDSSHGHMMEQDKYGVILVYIKVLFILNKF